MPNPVKELLPEFLNTLTQSCDNDKIAAFQTIPKFLAWVRKQHHLTLQQINTECPHEWQILERITMKSPHWWDSHEIVKIKILFQCPHCGKVKKEEF
jgi:hypothetical protein